MGDNPAADHIRPKTSRDNTIITHSGKSEARDMVVGIGASAGGQEALEQFFTVMPADCGLAFVVVMHLPPDGPSFLAEMLAPHTSMTVLTAGDGMPCRPNTVYVIPAGKELTLRDGQFQLQAPTGPGGTPHPVDRFFHSLASDKKEHAVAVVLSGAGTDGAAGAIAVSDAGGIVLVQQPDSAANPSMPLNTLASGAVDLVLPTEDIAEKLAGMANVSTLRAPGAYTLEEDLAAIFTIVKARTGHDFSSYKRNTVIRRIERRMAVRDIAEIKKYLALLEADEKEARALWQEILIGVTSFFRDPEAFETLRRDVLPRLFAGRNPEEPVRIWHACCATGEEVYSTAILIREFLNHHQMDAKVQIFATDIDEGAIAQARSGLYGDEIRTGLSEGRLKTFFTRVDGRLRVAKTLREMVVFAHHNLIKDPPFSRLDLLVCRNFLIYLNPDMQKRLFSIFHQALKPRGILFLGTAETAGQHSELFAPINKKWKTYERLEGSHDESLSSPLAAQVYRLPQSGIPPQSAIPGEPKPGQLAEKRIVERYAPPCVVVNENYQVIHVSTRADTFLNVPVGEPTRDLLKMAREELRPALRAAIHKTFSEQKQVVFHGVKVVCGETEELVDVLSEPLNAPPPSEKLALVILERAAIPSTDSASNCGESPLYGDETSRGILVQQLEEQLRITQEQLQTLTEQLQSSQEGFVSANEELISINEEYQSANEELQSTNEELETSKEELQVLNEELSTVNNELLEKVEELDLANSDMENLFANSEIATIFLDRQLSIRRFSPAMASIFNLIPADSGRPFRHLAGTIDWTALPEDARSVLATLAPVEREVSALEEKRHFLMRILPYRNIKGAIDGIVVTLVDITERKRIEEALQESEEQLRLFIEHAPVSLAMFDQDMRYLSVSRRWRSNYSLDDRALIGESHYDVFPEITPEWKDAHRRGLAGEVLRTEADHFVRADGSELWVRWEIRPWRHSDGSIGGIIIFTEDITERKLADEALRRSEEEFRIMFTHSSVAKAQTDPITGRFLKVNAALCRLSGYSESELLERTLSTVIPSEDYEALLAKRGELVRGEAQSVTTEHRYLRPDGSVVWVYVTINLIRDETGHPLHTMAVIQDISERKRNAERQEILAETARRLLASDSPQHVVDTLCQKVMAFLDCQTFFNFLVDEPAGRLHLNACAGIPEAEAEKIEWLDYGVAVCGCAARDACRVVAEDIPNTPDPRTELVKSFGIQAYACHPLIAQGQTLGTLSFGTRTRSHFSDDDLALMKAVADQVAIAIVRKQTEEELRRAKEAAEAATRAKGQFLANMSHELRTPMTGVLGMLDLVLLDELPDEQRGYLETVQQSAHSLLRILNDILDFSRIEAGIVTFDEEPFSLRDSVRGTLALFDIEARRKGLKLACEIAADTPRQVLGDEGRVRQILVNLIGNAIKFTAQGEVAVRVEPGAETSGGCRGITFTVADTGIGIQGDKQDVIFQPFSQADSSLTRRFGGTGLGLTISKDVAERMGGTVAVTSKEGEGSTFVVTLPLKEIATATPAAVAKDTEAGSAPAAVTGTRPHLLAAEDDPTIRNFLELVFRKYGFDLDLAVNGEEAVTMWSQGDYDLIIMDGQMPQMDGIVATRAIRAHEKIRGGHIPIVALTAHAFSTDREKYLDAGMDAYVAKPIKIQKLLDVVKDLLGSKWHHG
jgi:two-component system CheB/CheR fusion protein